MSEASDQTQWSPPHTRSIISPSTLILHCTLLLEFELGGPFEGAIYAKRCIQCTKIFDKTKRKNSSLCAEHPALIAPSVWAMEYSFTSAKLYIPWPLSFVPRLIPHTVSVEEYEINNVVLERKLESALLITSID